MAIEHTHGPLVCERTATVTLNNGEEVELHEITTPTPPFGDFETTGYAFTAEDGKLYAAAPDLLEALELAWELIHKLQPTVLGESDFAHGCREDRAKIRKVLERASTRS